MAVHPPKRHEDLRGLSLCAGVGGLDLGIHLAEPGYRTVGYVERNAFSAATLVARMEYSRWDEYNYEYLRRAFDSEEYSSNYKGVGQWGVAFFVGGGRDLGREVNEYLERFHKKIGFLISLADRLELISLAPNVVAAQPFAPPKVTASISLSTKKIFMVHGQDNEMKAIVARFIEQCGLEPIILHEQADQGRTIIEKFEANSDVAFAVVLLSPDDLGGLAQTVQADSSVLRPRARQNVVLELGYFIGRLGRHRVCALKKGEVELPSDFSGVVYTPYDGAGEGWKMKLARELKSAGLDIDLENALLK